ncbi:hypothetical protein B0H10DRAFT_1958500 [Mycena sp. CBHHK59/15]|nr:hypothetical protein B0H10DRAFT_1958500 [Mycena sp. CBHHK59/15]
MYGRREPQLKSMADLVKGTKPVKLMPDASLARVRARECVHATPQSELTRGISAAWAKIDLSTELSVSMSKDRDRMSDNVKGFLLFFSAGEAAPPNLNATLSCPSDGPLRRLRSGHKLSSLLPRLSEPGSRVGTSISTIREAEYGSMPPDKARHECGSPAGHGGLTRENTHGKTDLRVRVPVATGFYGSGLGF